MYKDNNFLGSQGSCGCDTEYGCGVMKGDTWGIGGYPLAMVYAPLQVWKDLYDKENALCRGTLFKELDLPFVGCEQKSNCSCDHGCAMNRYGNRGGIRNG